MVGFTFRALDGTLFKLEQEVYQNWIDSIECQLIPLVPVYYINDEQVDEKQFMERISLACQ
jgi:hypothetical protein